jgi:hypothetical protein
MTLKTPVTLILYRRPELTRQVVERVASADPDHLLVIADGPRNESEREACETARNVVREFGWRGQVSWEVSETNLGLRRRVSSGLDWVFSRVERSIILEDDCVPEPSFFSYCTELLDRYANDERVMEIAGSSLTDQALRSDCSYYFSKYYHPWGWATWRRAWRLYDEAISIWPKVRQRGGFPSDGWMEKRFWQTVFDRTHSGDLQTWDYQWLFAMWSNSGLSAVPRVNLVRNIGFGPGGTHYTRGHPFSRLPIGELGTLEHPEEIIRNARADISEFKRSGFHPLVRLIRTEIGGVKLVQQWRRKQSDARPPFEKTPS